MGTNTGKPGFVVKPDDLIDESLKGVYNYDIGSPDRPNDPSYPDQSTSDKTGDIKTTDTTGHDLSKKTRVTLSNYLGKKTTQNYYPTDPATIDVTLNDTDRNQSTARPTPTPSIDSDYKWFGTGKDITLPRRSVELEGWKKSEAPLPVEPELATLLKKGKMTGESGEFDGNELLPRARDASQEKLHNYTRAILSNNRFASSARYVPKSGTTDQSSPEDVELVARNGRYNETYQHPKFGSISSSRMAQIGIELMLRASQDSHGNNPSSGAAAAGAALPSANQSGLTKIDVMKLEALDVIKSLTNDEIPDSQFSSVSKSSWGSLNNVHDQYSGISSVGMIALAATLQISVGTVIFLMSKLFNTINGNNKKESGLYLGTSTQVSSFDVSVNRIFGLVETRHSYMKCVEKGNAVFFGLNELAFSGEQFNRFVKTSGFYAVLCRAIIRSGLSFLGAVGSSIDETNKVDGVKGFFTSLDSLSSSKVIAAMNMFAVIGDAALSEEEEDRYKTSMKYETTRVSKTTKDFKTKPIDYHGSAALMSSGRSPSMYLIPQNLSDLTNSTLGMGEPIKPGFDDNARSFLIKTTSNRLPVESSTGEIDNLEAIEKQLDSEYIPFYFHDVRTNEVVSFHAFLENLGDAYSANYDTSSGFGRVESVRTYKETTRKIDMSFYVVATDTADFDHMWAKINKLTTLLYPQYTEGRRVKSGDLEFIQPFSQMIGTSPLVRIRLGNLLRSNYSRFTLARLFGATLNGTNFGSTPENIDVTLTTPQQKDYHIYIEDEKKKIGTKWIWVSDKQSFTPRIVSVKNFIDNEHIECSIDDSKINNTYVVNSTQLSPTRETLIRFKNSRSYLKSRDIQNFFGSNNNAIVKSFKSTQGKGLAGFIESMNFEWLGKYTWDIDKDKQVPMMCKVTLSFSPIHDISPGIDSQGHNRAPIYPVGLAAPRDDSESSKLTPKNNR